MFSIDVHERKHFPVCHCSSRNKVREGERRQICYNHNIIWKHLRLIIYSMQTHAKGSYTLMHAHHVHIWTHTALCFMYTRVTTQPLTSLYCMSDWSFYALAWCLSSHDRHNMTSERWGVKGERSDMSYQWFNPPVPYDWHACPQTVRHQSGVTKGFNYFRNGPATVKDRSATAGQYSRLKFIETWPA